MWVEDVKALQVFRNDGTEAFTDLRTLIKVQQSGNLDEKVARKIRRAAAGHEKMDTLRNDPYFKKVLPTGKTIHWMEILANSKGRSVHVLTFLKPLENESDCQTCHGAKSKVQGIVRVSTDVSGLEAQTSDLRNRQIGITLATLVIVSFALVFFLRWTVIERLEVLASGAAKIGRGEFENIPEVSGNDEIARLGQAFRNMTISLKSAYADIQSKNFELENTLEELKESRQKIQLLENIKSQLAKFIPASVQRMLEDNPNAETLEKKDKDVTVLFLDIDGYTRMSASYSQDIVNAVIEKYFSAFLDVVTGHGGDINETAGDGLMVIFQDENDPKAHAANAIDAAIKMRGRVAAFNDARLPGYPLVFANIGINSGVASVGANKFESPGGSARWTFTASGLVTNISSRIGSIATSGRIFIGEETRRRVGDQYALVDMGTHLLKNISDSIQIYQVIPVGVVFPKGTFDPVDAMGEAREASSG